MSNKWFVDKDYFTVTELVPIPNSNDYICRIFECGVEKSRLFTPCPYTPIKLYDTEKDARLVAWDFANKKLIELQTKVDRLMDEWLDSE